MSLSGFVQPAIVEVGSPQAFAVSMTLANRLDDCFLRPTVVQSGGVDRTVCGAAIGK